MGPRTNLVATLLIAGVTLLVAIAIGNEMGNRVLGQATERGPAIAATPVVTPLADASADAGPQNWKREQIVSVATDPAFPDPRVTPEPPAPPPPVVHTPAPRPVATPSPLPSRTPSVPYTSPPLPIPIVSHTPEQGAGSSAPSGETGTATPPQ